MGGNDSLYLLDRSLLRRYPHIAGVDEAGRGPLAGPVVVAAVLLDYERPIRGINDSKKLSEAQRERLFDLVIESAVAYKIVEVEPEVIDKMNILQATLWGMKTAAENLTPVPDLCLVDGNKIPRGMTIETRAVVKGDATHAAIAAASILAKVHRDRLMIRYHAQYPHYGFDSNKGYPTAMHLEAIRLHGICPIHRRSYGPVAQISIF